VEIGVDYLAVTTLSDLMNQTGSGRKNQVSE
jgi:hypothetical protein